MGDLIEVIVYRSWDIWVADCPRLDCLGAEHYGHAPTTGHVGGLTREGFRCNACGLVCRSVWPHNAADILWVLAKRPMKHTRTWMPHETLRDLIVENVAHGVPMPELDAGLTFADDRLIGVELGAANRLMIGGG